MTIEPSPEHLWLQKLVGDWTSESEARMSPSEACQMFNGRQSARSVGGIWVVCDGVGEMPDGEMGLMTFTFGYDTAKKLFVGTFFGSMMTNL